MDTRRRRHVRSSAAPLSTVLVASLVSALVLAGCSGAADIANGTPTSSTQASGSTEGPNDSPTTGPADLADLPEGFGEGPPGSGLQRFVDQEVSWEPCEGGECADIWVPLDYDDPDGLAITLKAKRKTATDDAKRRGSLFINPGGPGESGIEYLGFIGLPDNVRAMYDVVGFDPRGVASSTPVDCLSDSDLDAYIASDPTPDDDQEVQQLEDGFATFSQGCVDESGPLVEHLSTVEVARDLDLMRQLVRDKKLNFFGASYGTYIGATYAGLFPKKVGRMVLDGAVDPLADPHKVAVHQTAGFQTALDAYLQDCIDKGNCPLGDSVAEGEQSFIDFFKSLDQSPLPTSSGRDLTEGLGFLGVIVTLYSKESWPYLTQAMQQALSGSGDTLLALADFYNHRKADGTFTGNSTEANPAVNCLDHPQDVSVQQIEGNEQEFLKASNVFGRVGMWFDYGCSNWPVTSTEKQPDFSAKGAPPIVVVGTTRDPATPYEQAVKLADELDSGVLLSRDGDGHTAYGSGNSCIDDAINGFLLSGAPPADGKQC
jgi:pimeloyl-ACP methyl ester carboxylesterase